MPYVFTDTGWGADDSDVLTTVRARQLFRPVGVTLPAGIVTVGAFSGTAQTFTNVATYLWNSGVYNTQGQRWVGVDGTPANGCRNEATPRTSSSVRYNHITEFEYLYTGQALDIMFIGSSYYEVLVYIEGDDKMMHRAEASPKTGTTTGLRHLPLNFAAGFHGRVRVVLAGGLFVGVKCEQSAIVKPSPDRMFAVCDGAEWSEGAGIKQGSGTSWLVGSLATYLFERTGWVWAQRGQPDTGYFRNGGATVSDDTATATNQTRFFSADRKAWLAADFTLKPLVFLITGSRTDGGTSGATGVSNGAMAVRAKACYDWIRSQDRYVKIAQMSVSPNGSGSGHNLNFIEQSFAIAATLKLAETIDATTWFNTTQRTALIGADGVNPGDDLFKFWANMIAMYIGNMMVDVLRSRRAR